MKNSIFIFALIFPIIFTKSLKAQVSSYSFTQSSSVYGSLTNGTQLGPRIQDDMVSTAALPFNFTYNAVSYNTLNVCSNGYLSFNNLTGFEYQALSDMFTADVIAPFAQDLFMGTVVSGDLATGSNTISNISLINSLSVGDTLNDISGDFGANPVITQINGNSIVVSSSALNTTSAANLFFMNGSITQHLVGTAPNRICIFEFKNMTRFAVQDEVINFQVKLHETSNQIEFVYGPATVGSIATMSEVGLKGSNTNDFNSRAINIPNNWNSSVAASFITDACNFSNTMYPVNGLKFVWTPTTCVAPTLTVVKSHSLLCSGQSATLEVSGATSFTWNGGANTSSIVVSPTVNSTYTVVANNGLCQNSATVSLQVTPTPTLNINLAKQTVCRNNATSITASGATSYTWSNGAVSPSITVNLLVTTTYTVKGASNGCISEKTITQNVNNCTTIDEKSSSEKLITFYPNPFSNQLTVAANETGTTQILLRNALGQEIFSYQLTSGEKTTVDTSTLLSGFYFLTSETDGVTHTSKLIKQ